MYIGDTQAVIMLMEQWFLFRAEHAGAGLRLPKCSTISSRLTNQDTHHFVSLCFQPRTLSLVVCPDGNIGRHVSLGLRVRIALLHKLLAPRVCCSHGRHNIEYFAALEFIALCDSQEVRPGSCIRVDSRPKLLDCSILPTLLVPLQHVNLSATS